LRGTFVLRNAALERLDMPIGAYLDGTDFDAETIRLMGIAFEMALASRGPTLAHANPLREALARKIIDLAKAGECDPEHLCEGALRDLPPGVSAS
jgi:hypothetical protein